MAMITMHKAIADGRDTRLAPRIAAVLVVKVVGLALIWLLFVRDHRVAVDARSAAAAFGLAGAPTDANPNPEGKIHGQ